jgi:hypothetical protein
MTKEEWESNKASMDRMMEAYQAERKERELIGADYRQAMAYLLESNRQCAELEAKLKQIDEWAEPQDIPGIEDYSSALAVGYRIARRDVRKILQGEQG